MASDEKEPPTTNTNNLEWEAPKPKKKEWRGWGKNLIKRRTTKQLIEDALLMRFKDQRAIQEKFKQEFFARKVKELLLLRTQQRDIIFERFHASMHAMKLKEQYGIAMQRALRASWHDILGLQYFAKQKDKKRRTKMESMITHFDKKKTDEFSKDIEDFESKTGFTLGGDKPSLEADVGKKTPSKPPPISKKLSKIAIKPIEETMPNPLDPKLQEEQAKAAKACILEIKERKLKEFSNVLERLKKQRQDTLEEEAKNLAIDEEEAIKKSEEDEVLKLAQEKEEAEKQQILKEEQKAKYDEWLLQQQEMKAKSRADFDGIQAYDHECYMMYFNDKVDDINNEYDSWQIDIKRKQKMRREKHYNFCFDIILQFVSMAECLIEYRLKVGKKLPIDEWRQWKNIFIKGALLPIVLPRPLPQKEPPNEIELRNAKEELEAYLDEMGEYASPQGVEPIGKNKELGQFLVDIDQLAQSLVEPFQRPDLKNCFLLISIVGVPNAGKRILAKNLATTYGISLIDYKQVQDSAIAAAMIEEEKLNMELAAQIPNSNSNPNLESKEELLKTMLSQKSRFGLQAKSAIENKTQVPDDVIANLVLLTMLHPEEYTPLSEINALSAKSAPPLAPKKPNMFVDKLLNYVLVKDAQPTPTLAKQTGFILDGFPQTKGQAAALEKCLTGFDFDAQEAKKERQSKIAPPPQLEIVTQEESGLHIYFIIEAPLQDELQKQLSKNTIDPSTTSAHHPQTSLVSLGDKSGIIDVLQPLNSKEKVFSKLATKVDVFESLKDFLKKFNNIYFLPQHCNESGVVTPNTQMAIDIVTTFMDNKSKTETTNLTSDNMKSTIEAMIQAQKEVDVANNVAKTLAKVLFKAKLAEVEVEQAPRRDSSSSNPKASKGDASKKGVQVEKVSGAIAKMLDEVTKIVLELHNFATAATLASEQAQKHIQEFLTTKGSLEAANFCKDKVEEALGVAREATTKATAARTKCSNLLEAARALAFGEPLPPLPLMPMVPQVEPLLDSFVEVAKPLPNLELTKIVEVAELINKIWDELEKKYLTTIQEGFRLLIREQEKTIPILIEVKRNFVALLKEDNGKQELFEDFQERWNRVEPEHRHEKKMIARMYEEGIKFGEILRTLALERLQNGKQMEQQSLEDLLDERTSTFTSIFTLLVQGELDRHIETCGLLHEYYTQTMGSKFSNEFKCNLSTTKRQPSWRFVTPKWLIPLEDSYPEFHMVLSEALAKASSLIDEIGGKPSRDKKLQQRRQNTRRMSGRRTTWMRVVDPTFREVINLDQNVNPIISREHQIFGYRLELLAKCACKYLADLQPICDGAWGQMNDWLMKRCNDESSLVEEVRSMTLEAAQESIPLWYPVWMESEFKVEDEEIMEIVHVPPEPNIDLTIWHIKVMESIVDAFKTFHNGFGMVQDVIKATLSAIDHVQMMWRSVPQNNIYPRLPRYKSRRYGHFQHWANLTYDIIEQSKGEIDTQFVSVIEWRGFLVSLADAHFDYIISAATIEDIVQAQTDFFLAVTTKQPGNPSEGCITLDDFLNIQLWFDKKHEYKFGDLEDVEDIDNDKVGNETYDLGKSLKVFVFSLLENSIQWCKQKKSGLPWQTLLLYLCRDACSKIALRKVFTVLANSMSPDEAQLTPEELTQVLYPCGVDGAIEVGCITWTIADIEDVLFRACIEKATPLVEPKTFSSYVSSDSEIQYEKDTIEKFFESHSSSHESQMNAMEIGTIEDFLSNVLDSKSSSEKTLTEWQESEEGLYLGLEAPIPKRLTVEDCIKLNATAKLCSALGANFKQHSAHVMQMTLLTPN